MAKIGLSFYSVEVIVPSLYKGKETYKRVPLDNLNGKTLSDCVYDFLKKKLEKYQKDLEKEKIYRPSYIETEEYKIDGNYAFSSVFGVVKSGDYGVEVEIVDSDTSLKVFDQKKEQAGVLPFGFGVYFSEGIKTGILVTQSYGAKGMSNHFKKMVTNAIEQSCDKHKVVIKSVYPDAYFRRLLDNEQIKDICIETYKKPKVDDKDDAIKNGEIIDYSTREIKYKRPIFKDKNNIFRMFAERRNVNELKGLTNDDEEIKNIKVDFLVNGIPKTVNYDTYFNLRIAEDITNDVKINNDTGHPQANSLLEQMDNYVLMYLVNMKIISEMDKGSKLERDWSRHCHIKTTEDDKEEIVDKRNEKDTITV